MVRLVPTSAFEKSIKHLDSFERQKLEKRLRKILENPDVGKPLKYRRGERSVYVPPFRIVYAIQGDDIILLKFEHRKSVYKR